MTIKYVAIKFQPSPNLKEIDNSLNLHYQSKHRKFITSQSTRSTVNEKKVFLDWKKKSFNSENVGAV